MDINQFTLSMMFRNCSGWLKTFSQKLTASALRLTTVKSITNLPLPFHIWPPGDQDQRRNPAHSQSVWSHQRVRGVKSSPPLLSKLGSIKILIYMQKLLSNGGRQSYSMAMIPNHHDCRNFIYYLFSCAPTWRITTYAFLKETAISLAKLN